MKLVGLEQYQRLLSSIRFYERCGFTYIDVPWCVSEEAMLITRPEWARSSICTLIAGGNPMCPVASAEQSFLQLQMDAIAKGERITGRYVTITPCFRNEPALDDLHQAYFMKVELIDWDCTDQDGMLNMIDSAQCWMNGFVPCTRVPNTESDPIAVIPGIDINTIYTGIELGSYGVREHPKVGRWVYGTGLAEPRMTYAIDQDKTEDL